MWSGGVRVHEKGVVGVIIIMEVLMEGTVGRRYRKLRKGE